MKEIIDTFITNRMYRFYILTYSWAPNQISDGQYSKLIDIMHTAIYVKSTFINDTISVNGTIVIVRWVYNLRKPYRVQS